MLTGPTLDRLHALNLGGMARALAEQRENPAYAELSFEDRLGMLVGREATDRADFAPIRSVVSLQSDQSFRRFPITRP